MPREAPTAEPLGDTLKVVVDSHAPPGDLVPALARLLRRLRDRERVQAAGDRRQSPLSTEGPAQ